MKTRLIATVTLLISVALSGAQNKQLEAALKGYRSKLAQIESTRQDQEENLNTKYAAALNRLRATLDTATEVDALLAIAAEIAHVRGAESPPQAGIAGADLLAAQATYREQLAMILAAADSKRVAASDSAIAILRKLTGTLAAADELDAALAAESERKAIETDAKYLAAKGRLAAVTGSEGGSSSSSDLNMAIPRTGLIAYFPFDGRIEDTKGHAVPLTLTGERHFASGRSGRALNLEKTTSGDVRPTVAFPLPAGGNSDFSLSYCIRPDMSAHAQKVIFSIGKKDDATPFSVSFQQRGEIGAEVTFNPPGDDYFQQHAPIPRPAAEWHHVVITVTKGEVCYFLDGQLKMSMPSKSNRFRFPGLLGYIGTYRYWNGSGDSRQLHTSGGPNMLLDELAIYDRALSAADARSLAKNYNLFDDGR